MWIKINEDVFEKSDFKTLNFILQLLTWYPTNSIERYKVFIDVNAKVANTENYKRFNELDKKLIEEGFNDFVINSEAIKFCITLSPSQRNEFNLEEAIRFFNQPVSIVVENSLNDSYFLLAIFNHFDKKIGGIGVRRLSEFVKNDWIQFVNAGGWTNVKNYINGKLKTYSNLPAAYEDNAHKYLRCFVIMDSDKKHPGESLENAKKVLIKWLSKKNVKTHVLKKRAMENYMTDDVIKSVPALKKFNYWTKAYVKLNADQKDFLDYNKGFSKKDRDGKALKKRNELPVEILNLYSNLLIDEYDGLDKGLKLTKFKDTFPTFFENGAFVYKKSLLKREGGTETENEFLEIIQKINELL